MAEGLFGYPNVVGWGRGMRVRGGVQTDEPCVTVLVSDKLPEVMLSRDEMLPGEYQGLPTDVLPAGTIRALQSRTGRWRPAPGGVSIGHFAITAGTFGAVVKDRATGDRLILSNNHVLANSNAAKVGDAILQPGPIDGGRPTDKIAELYTWVDIAFEGGCLPFARPQRPNRVDAAVARPLTDGDVLESILDVGIPSGWIKAGIGLEVLKSGRTTALTWGQVQVIDATVKVSYGSAGQAVFEGQIVTGAMSQGGDSGSLLVDNEPGTKPAAVGLLFAGSDQVTIYNPIEDVLDLLEVNL